MYTVIEQMPHVSILPCVGGFNMLKHLQDPWVKATPADAPLGPPVE